MAAYLAFQFSMIARIDDTAMFQVPDLQPFEEFSYFGVTSKLCWSKNVLEERDTPTHLFGAEDWRYCVLSLLGFWFELHFYLNPEPNENLFGAFGLTDPLAIKSSAGYYLRKLFHDEEFILEILMLPMYLLLQFHSKCALFLGGPFCLKCLTALQVRNEWVELPHKSWPG
jgi:hypothetical protein